MEEIIGLKLYFDEELENYFEKFQETTIEAYYIRNRRPSSKKKLLSMKNKNFNYSHIFLKCKSVDKRASEREISNSAENRLFT